MPELLRPAEVTDEIVAGISQLDPSRIEWEHLDRIMSNIRASTPKWRLFFDVLLR